MKKVKLIMNTYGIVSDAVEDGIAGGVIRADKHADDPLTEAQRERVKQTVHDYVMNALCEVIHFG